MRKKILTTLLLTSLFSSPLAYAQDEGEDPIFYTDEDDELFNKGKFVGKETDSYLIQIRRTQRRNWGVALGTAALGIATVVFVSKDHHERSNQAHHEHDHHKGHHHKDHHHHKNHHHKDPHHKDHHDR